MKALFLLVLLSQNGAGDINAAFVNTQSMAQCEQKAAMVRGIFASARIPILGYRCQKSELRFTPFGHVSSSRAPRHFYLIRFGSDKVEIQAATGWRDCMAAAAEKPHHYCASSVQRLE